jgi:hypothetical protein
VQVNGGGGESERERKMDGFFMKMRFRMLRMCVQERRRSLCICVGTYVGKRLVPWNSKESQVTYIFLNLPSYVAGLLDGTFADQKNQILYILKGLGMETFGI